MNQLEKDLRKTIRGEVRFDDGTRAVYSTDASNYRQVPIGVVIPRSIEDVIHTMKIAHSHNAPVLSRGGGTSLAGQCCNVAVLIDFSKYLNHVLTIDAQNAIGEVEPGTILDNLRDAAELHHLTFGPDPASHSRCTLGGMIGNNSCGVHSVYSGKTEENVHELEVLTYRGLRLRVGQTTEQDLEKIILESGPRGEIYSRLKVLRDRYANLIRERYPKIPRRVSGYNLNQLLPENGFHVARALVGTEGTCVTVLTARLNLVHSPPFRKLVVLGFKDMPTAGDHLMKILALKPLAVEGIDDEMVDSMKKKGLLLENVKLLPQGGGWLLVELGGATSDEAMEAAQRMVEAMQNLDESPAIKLCKDNLEAKMMWRVRESALGATASIPGQKLNWEGWEDSAVPPERIGAYLRELRKLMARFDYHGGLYGHLGDGCVHTRIDFDLQSSAGIEKYRQFMNEAADLVISFGGSLSGEHGDGQARAELLSKMFGSELVEAFREFKSIWDPDGKMNPGKVVDPYPMHVNLRMASFAPSKLRTHFQFQPDGSFANTTLRCVGVGDCRKLSGGTMCPSFQVTREEIHSTRGRARILFEMLNGETVKQGWNSESVKEALDLCLSCKACRRECPVGVDMASYKAEFLSHYYEAHSRPISAYALGWISRWSRIASKFPAIVNLFTQTELLSGMMKKIAGISEHRKIPRFANETFRSWFSRRKRNQSQDKIILWIDTFTNYFYPEVAQSTVEALEALGISITIPGENLCCGRPLYEYGMLDTAKDTLNRAIDFLQADPNEKIPIVGLEPGCVSVFRDEMLSLFSENEKIKQLHNRIYLLSEYLSKRKDLELPKLQRKAIVHPHCHQKSMTEMKSEEEVLERLGLDFEILDSGCCGMAGAFGFENAHYDLSMRCGERILFPSVRGISDETLLLTNGFSCREQILQGTGKRALHLGEVLQMACLQTRDV
jgi:FAD/FMN-containing dehydrogenase/Fe-S oxidoreductase